MAGARFDGTAAIEHLSGLLDAIDDPSPVLKEISEAVVLRSTRERFKTQTAPDGTAWAALQPWYQKEKRRNKNRTLTLDGYLRSRLTWQFAGDRTVEIGSNLPYAAVHQFGATIKPRAAKVLMFRGHVAKSVTIPARPYLGLSDEDRSEIVGRTLEWLQRIMK